MTVYDIVIIGSGFGGAVMAARLGAWVSQNRPGGSVLVIEKGDDSTGLLDPQSEGGAINAQGNRFRQSFAPPYLTSVTELFRDSSGAFQSGSASMQVAAGRGMGGGSTVYDGVSLRAPTEAFEQTRDGRRLWPSYYSRSVLDPYYAIVEQRLSVNRLAWTNAQVPYWQLATKRDFVFAEGCRRIGATATSLKLADANDANEGWWNAGQRFAGRQNLTKNYLLDAQAANVAFWSGCEVDGIAPTADGYSVSGTDRRGGSNTRFGVECKLLVVAAGAVTSTGLLLRSMPSFGGTRPRS